MQVSKKLKMSTEFLETWAQSSSKHVEDSNKHIIEEIVHQVGHLPELYKNAWSEKYKIYELGSLLTCLGLICANLLEGQSSSICFCSPVFLNFCVHDTLGRVFSPNFWLMQIPVHSKFVTATSVMFPHVLWHQSHDFYLGSSNYGFI
jgi:hypothetical protein